MCSNKSSSPRFLEQIGHFVKEKVFRSFLFRKTDIFILPRTLNMLSTYALPTNLALKKDVLSFEYIVDEP